MAYETLDYAAQPKTGPRIPMQDLPVIVKHRRPYDDELNVTMFRQTWGSTALGYGGIGGAAMTNAYTVVVATRASACVYFGDGPLAYRCVFAEMTEDQLSQWTADLGARRMVSRREALVRYGATLPAASAHEEEDE